MRNLFKLSPIVLLLTGLFAASCDKQQDMAQPAATSSTQNAEPIDPYGIELTNRVYAEGFTTFTYTVTPAGRSKDISHLNMTLPCKKDDGSYLFGAGNVTNVTVSAAGTTCTTSGVSSTDGAGEGNCNMSAVPNFFKIDGFSCIERDASSPYTVSFTLPGNVGTKDGTAWIKYSTTCQPIAVAVPGCLVVNNVGCSYSQGFYFAKPLDNGGGVAWPTASVTVGGTTVTQQQGRDLWAYYTGPKGSVYSRAFFQAATIKLSSSGSTPKYNGGGTYPGNPVDATNTPITVDSDVKLISDLLANVNLANKTAVSLSAAQQKQLQEAAGRIGNWIGAEGTGNHCM